MKTYSQKQKDENLGFESWRNWFQSLCDHGRVLWWCLTSQSNWWFRNQKIELLQRTERSVCCSRPRKSNFIEILCKFEFYCKLCIVQRQWVELHQLTLSVLIWNRSCRLSCTVRLTLRTHLTDRLDNMSRISRIPFQFSCARVLELLHQCASRSTHPGSCQNTIDIPRATSRNPISSLIWLHGRKKACIRWIYEHCVGHTCKLSHKLHVTLMTRLSVIRA